MSIKAKFDTWIREDRLYNPKHLTSNEYDVCRRWFERGYNESLLDIQRLKMQVGELQEKLDKLVHEKMEN